ncbi:hypothetical protein Tco_1113293 [Tanacetum coccineum]|uniref:Integrase, catalytic region, zinc finger, CCHC-type, peptidase aspartic, catalytic n=1 Tax=Tanacetum coccineum TaxID=301880 RepID=A0ABQ5IRW1_9ASTR
MELYMLNRQHGRMILESVENGPLIWPSIEENRVTRPKKYSELSATESIQADGDIKATNIILQGLPPEVYALVSNHKVAKKLWERIQLLMQGTSLTKQERDCKLYDEFDKFAYRKGETLRDFYLRFSLLLNDINIYNIKLEQFQVNTKFLNTLPPEWSKFMIDVKLKGDDPSDAINHMMSFLTTVGRQTSLAVGTTRTYTLGASGSNSGKQRTVICYNCKGECYMSKQCTKPKRKRDDSQFKDKVLLVQAQVSGQILHEEKLAFLADLGIPEGQAIQTVIAHNAAYQAKDLDAYDSDCNELDTAKVSLMVNLTHYGSDALVEVYNHDNMNNNMINQAVQAMPSSKQSNVVNHSETKITNDSNIIPYSRYMIESQQAVVQNSNSSAQQDALILSVIEQLKNQVVNCTKINLENKSVNDTLNAELERYKEQVKVLKEVQNVISGAHDYIVFQNQVHTRSIFTNCSQVDKPQFFYDHTTKQALGFQNPFYLKKARQLEPKLYDGNVIKNTCAIVIPDSKETLMLAEESHSKMLLKQKDPMMLEKKVNTTPVDYANSINSVEPTLSSRPTKVKVPKELLKVSMVNTSLKKLKHHLAGFDVVVKERTIPTAITEGS